MDGIYYNQIVTEEVLNAMATDLGATDFNSFTGNKKFGADKLNEITQSLVSEGILISDDMCRCVKTDTGITIMPGTIIFKSGAKKTISENMSIDAANGTVVYALNNIAAGTCTIEVSDAFPTDTTIDYVPLCTINETGGITDKRMIACAKVDLPTGTVSETIEYSVYVDDNIGYVEGFNIQLLSWNRHQYLFMEDKLFEIKDIPIDTNIHIWEYKYTNAYMKFSIVGDLVKVSFRVNSSDPGDNSMNYKGKCFLF